MDKQNTTNNNVKNNIIVHLLDKETKRSYKLLFWLATLLIRFYLFVKCIILIKAFSNLLHNMIKSETTNTSHKTLTPLKNTKHYFYIISNFLDKLDLFGILEILSLSDKFFYKYSESSKKNPPTFYGRRILHNN